MISRYCQTTEKPVALFSRQPNPDEPRERAGIHAVKNGRVHEVKIHARASLPTHARPHRVQPPDARVRPFGRPKKKQRRL
jgi:hypothetical protein